MKSQLNKIALIFALVVLLAILLSAFFFGTPPSGASSGIITDHLHYGFGGGDCSADVATGDLYTPVDIFCQSQPGKPAAFLNLELGTGKTPTVTVEVPTEVTPTVEGTQKPTQEVTETATPKPTEIVTETSTPKPTEIVTEQPTKKPTEVATETRTPKPTQVHETKTPKPHCDNGEGNGGEGCSPSDHGNNDED